MGKYRRIYFQVAGALLALLAIVAAIGGDAGQGP